MLYLFTCFTSPYFYAWVALHGHEKDERALYSFVIIFETIFMFNILFHFLTDYVPDGEISPERDLAKIAERYLHTEFRMDFIPTFPLTFFFDNTSSKYWRLLYLIKVIRLIKGIEIYDVQMMMDYLKKKNTQNVLKNIENDPTLLQNLDLDLNKIDLLFNIRYLLKMIKLFLMIINVAYFTGVIWIIGCQINVRVFKDENSENEYFYDAYELDDQS